MVQKLGAFQYHALIDHRAAQNDISGERIRLNGRKRRAAISDAKREMLASIIAVLNKLRKFWPLSERTIHYHLLNNPLRCFALFGQCDSLNWTTTGEPSDVEE